MSRFQIVFLAVLVPSIILHEVSHGAVALFFGDDTARRAGRLTLNPARHVDPLGTVIVPALLVLSGAGAFGWAKPVPVDARKLRRPRDHALLVSLAGPATNLALLALATLAFRLYHPAGLAREVLVTLGLANLLLALFNLLPIPPLDGSALLERLMPSTWWPGYLRLRQYSMGILLVLVLLVPGVLTRLYQPAIDLWVRFL